MKRLDRILSGSHGNQGPGRCLISGGALASGATVTDIAKTENIGRTCPSKHANSPACRQLPVQFVNEEQELMLALFYRALRVIEHGFSARREYLLKDGQTLVGGPDHQAQLSVVS
jgi:hypothetical protein